jgi:hypothetical protein
MDLASFKTRYPSFTDDVVIQQALDDAGLFITIYDIADSQLEMAMGYLTAHMLTVSNGATEQTVTKVKADTVEVQFSDKDNLVNDWLGQSSYGRMLKLLIKPKVKGIGMVVV